MEEIGPGSIIEYEGEHLVVVDIVDDEDARMAVLRYPDDDPRRQVDADGGDVHLDAAPVSELTAVGHI